MIWTALSRQMSVKRIFYLSFSCRTIFAICTYSGPLTTTRGNCNPNDYTIATPISNCEMMCSSGSTYVAYSYNSLVGRCILHPCSTSQTSSNYVYYYNKQCSESTTALITTTTVSTSTTSTTAPTTSTTAATTEPSTTTMSTTTTTTAQTTTTTTPAPSTTTTTGHTSSTSSTSQATTASGVTSAITGLSSIWIEQYILRGLFTDQGKVFQMKNCSLVKCSALCTQNPTCISFFHHQQYEDCNGIDVEYSTITSPQAIQGARYYIRVSLTSAEKALYPIAKEKRRAGHRIKFVIDCMHVDGQPYVAFGRTPDSSVLRFQRSYAGPQTPRVRHGEDTRTYGDVVQNNSVTPRPDSKRPRFSTTPPLKSPQCNDNLY